MPPKNACILKRPRPNFGIYWPVEIYTQFENKKWPFFQPTNLIKIWKPKNVDLKGNPQRIYPTSHLFVDFVKLRYYAVKTVRRHDKIVGQIFPSDQTFSSLKLKLNRLFSATTQSQNSSWTNWLLGLVKKPRVTPAKKSQRRTIVIPIVSFEQRLYT